MSIEIVPDWMINLDDEDVASLKKILLASGFLKDIAGQYGVTYPTVRLRLDKLIQKVRINEDTSGEPYVALIKWIGLIFPAIIFCNSLRTAFLGANVLTLILLGIYLVQREKKKRRAQLTKCSCRIWADT